MRQLDHHEDKDTEVYLSQEICSFCGGKHLVRVEVQDRDASRAGISQANDLATYWASAVQFPAKARVRCLYRFQTGNGAHPISFARSPKDERLGRLLLLNMHLVQGSKDALP